jgi:hypothetical protein
MPKLIKKKNISKSRKHFNKSRKSGYNTRKMRGGGRENGEASVLIS